MVRKTIQTGLFILILALGVNASQTARSDAGQPTLFLPFVAQPQAGPRIAGCPVFPADNVWNTRIDSLPVDTNSAAYISSIGSATHLHADFGSGIWPDPGGFPMGIPFNIVPGSQARLPVLFDYNDQSDPGPYPIPSNVIIEGDPNSGDRHILLVDKDICVLYEIWNAVPINQPGYTWSGGSGAVFNLLSNDLRPDTWTSADAAGLPILPGLIQYDEVLSGEIRHAIRFTVSNTRRAYIWPARHYASYLTGSGYPPMGQRFRLKSTFNISTYSAQAQVLLKAMKKYGFILADNGSNWYFGGVPDERWNNTMLHELDKVHGSDFEAVDESSLMIDPNSAQARQP